MKENSVVELSGRVEAGDALTAMQRAGAQALIRQAVDAELQASKPGVGVASRPRVGRDIPLSPVPAGSVIPLEVARGRPAV